MAKGEKGETKKRKESKTTAKKRGRPGVITKKLEKKILAGLAQGKSLLRISREPSMPSRTAMMKKVFEDKEFADKYAKAKEEGGDALFEELLEIADQKTGDINRDRLRVDTRKWYLSKFKPKKYGNQVDLTSGGEKLRITPIFGGKSRGVDEISEHDGD